MGRKPIPSAQRSQPISFSLRPHLIEKIDEYAHDLRFSRSKFLMEAVSQYMIKHDMGYLDSDNNVHNMTLQQRMSVGLTALQQINVDGEEVTPNLIKNLKDSLSIYETKKLMRDIDSKHPSQKQLPIISEASDIDLTFEKVENKSEYNVYNFGQLIGLIYKDTNFKRKWIVEELDGSKSSHMTLKDAKAAIQEEWE